MRLLLHSPFRVWRAQIPSDKIVFNEKPDMKAREITDAGIVALKSGRYQMVRINYANPDMVGHTGVWEWADTSKSKEACACDHAYTYMFCQLVRISFPEPNMVGHTGRSSTHLCGQQ
eukprot:659459-Pelagomonas_calceolata.AAC.3